VRLAIVADTHMPKGRREIPARCLAELARADAIVHLGDFTAASIHDRLAALGPPLHAVHGNVDDAELRGRLPAESEVELDAIRIGLIHDAGARHGRLERMRQRFPKAAAVLFGHSHLPLHERDGEFQIFNPGSPTERRRAPTRTMGIGEIEDGDLRLRLIELE
jgi:putative phosphoesterase